MTAKRAGLGRNLSALLKQTDEELKAAEVVGVEQATGLLMLPVEALQPGAYQPRGAMDETALKALAASIKQQGVLQPIVVRQQKNSTQYEIIAGERRWRASQLAELSEVPVVVRNVNDETAMALALIENLQREALNVMDEARAMLRLTEEFGLTHQEIADLLSKSRAAVSNCLRLLQLAPPVMHLLESGQLDMGHARCLLKLAADAQIRAAELIVARGLSVRDAEALVTRLKQAKLSEKPPVAPKHNPVFDSALKQVSTYLGTSVCLKTSAAGSGRLMIDFKDAAHLKQLLTRLNQQTMEAMA